MYLCVHVLLIILFVAILLLLLDKFDPSSFFYFLLFFFPLCNCKVDHFFLFFSSSKIAFSILEFSTSVRSLSSLSVDNISLSTSLTALSSLILSSSVMPGKFRFLLWFISSWSSRLKFSSRKFLFAILIWDRFTVNLGFKLACNVACFV